MFLKKWLIKNFSFSKPKTTCISSFFTDDEYLQASDKFHEIKINAYKNIEYLIEDYFYPEYNISDNSIYFMNEIVLQNKILSNKINTNINIEDFEILDILDKGSIGKSFLVKYLKDNNFYTMKCLSKKNKRICIKETKLDNLENLNHPFILSAKFAFQNEKKIFLIYESFPLSNLQDFKNNNNDIIKFYFSQLVLAIDFLHKLGIIYQDINLNNVLVDSSGYLKLNDISFDVQQSEYTPPEVIIGESYSKTVDIWCLGILLYEMYHGYPPFNSNDKELINNEIIFKDVKFSENVFLPRDAKELINRLLDKNQQSRININEVRRHAYFDEIDFHQLLNKKITPHQPYSNIPKSTSCESNDKVENFENL